MAVLVILNGTRYRLPQSAADIPLRTHLKVVEAEAERMPEELKVILDERSAETKRLMTSRLPKRVYVGKFVPYYAHIVSLMTGIPEAQILGDDTYEGMPVPILEEWYWQIMAAYAKFECQHRRRFEIGGRFWQLPEELMLKSTFGEFAEAAQLEEYQADVAAGRWSSLAKVMAVLLQPEINGRRERFNPNTFDDILDSRAEVFMDAGMDIVYEVAFFLIGRNERLKTDSLISMIAQHLATSKRELSH